MQLADIATLPPTLSTAEAAEILGVGRDHLWKLAREGTAPVEPLRLGGTLRWPTAKLAQLLGLGVEKVSPVQGDELAQRRAGVTDEGGHAA